MTKTSQSTLVLVPYQNQSKCRLIFLSFLLSCGLSLEHVPLQYIYAMVFAVEEINNSTTLLPGVKLGYHIFDSCGRPPWALQAALSLVGGDGTSCNLTDPPNYPAGYGEGLGERRGGLLYHTLSIFWFC